MEAIVSAILGELACRSISFLMEACSKPEQTEEESLDRLSRLLLRVRAIVEDAECRRIANQAMLQQLNTLRQEMHRGHFTLDSLRYQAHERDDDEALGGGHGSGRRQHSFALSRLNPAKRLCICKRSRGESRSELLRIIRSLEIAVGDAAEFVLLSARYPRLTRQPYSTYLLLDKCMFSRQMETERVISFLLQGAQARPEAEHALGVLPIVGPANVGKSTLVEHACIDERVRGQFSKIPLLGGGDLSGDLGSGVGVIKHESRGASVGSKVLIIIELDNDVSEDLWRRLYSLAKNRFAHGSKIIVTSRSDKILAFGTTLPLRLQFLTREAYWYYFKVRAFGSVDVAMEHPKLASIAMEMAREMSGCFMGASIFGEMLRSRFSVDSWSLALAMYREFRKKNRFLSAPHPVDPWALTRPMLLPAVNKTTPGPGYFVVVKKYQTSSAHGDGAAPKVSIQDVMIGNARPRGNFTALAWRSHLPPHYNYVFSCEQRIPVNAAYI